MAFFGAPAVQRNPDPAQPVRRIRFLRLGDTGLAFRPGGWLIPQLLIGISLARAALPLGLRHQDGGTRVPSTVC